MKRIVIAALAGLAVLWMGSLAARAELPPGAENWEAECKAGKATSCYFYGIRLSVGDDIQKDVSRGIDYMVEACKLGLYDGCGRAGALLDSGKEIAQNQKAAIYYLATACEHDFSRYDICYRAAKIALEGKAVKQDIGSAEALLHKGCKNGQKSSCQFAASIYTEGRFGVKVDAFNSRFYSGEACRLGVYYWCAQAGYLLMGGMGLEKMIPEAKQYLGLGCDGNDGLSCANLANLLMKEDFNGNNAKATALFKKACDLSPVDGCSGLGYIYEHSGKTNDAIKYYEMSCAAGDSGGCRGGAGVYAAVKDYRKSEALARKACDLKDNESCKYAATLAQNAQAMREWDAYQAKLQVVWDALDKGDIPGALDLAVNQVRSRDAAAKVIRAAQRAGALHTFDPFYFVILDNWFTIAGYEDVHAIVNAEVVKMRKADIESQKRFRVTPLNNAPSMPAGVKQAFDNYDAMHRRNMESYQRGGQASVDVQRSLDK